eukprot:364426-Chlamydomonas_euryale.AAC.27
MPCGIEVGSDSQPPTKSSTTYPMTSCSTSCVSHAAAMLQASSWHGRRHAQAGCHCAPGSLDIVDSLPTTSAAHRGVVAVHAAPGRVAPSARRHFRQATSTRPGQESAQSIAAASAIEAMERALPQCRHMHGTTLRMQPWPSPSGSSGSPKIVSGHARSVHRRRASWRLGKTVDVTARLCCGLLAATMLQAWEWLTGGSGRATPPVVVDAERCFDRDELHGIRAQVRGYRAEVAAGMEPWHGQKLGQTARCTWSACMCSSLACLQPMQPRRPSMTRGGRSYCCQSRTALIAAKGPH